jgi:hypothetical protein
MEYTSVNDKKQDSLTLDFDGFAADVSYAQCLSVTDKLHDIIAEEYKKSIKKPVYDYMERDE